MNDVHRTDVLFQIMAAQQGVIMEDRPEVAPTLPPTYKRLISRGVGKSFREVAVVDEAAMQQPGEGQVSTFVLFLLPLHT